MLRYVFILLTSLSLRAQDNVQYNILMVPEDTSYTLLYEKLVYDDNPRKGQQSRTASMDSFLIWLMEDIETFSPQKRGLLFYVHGMWGSQRGTFLRAYKLMDEHFLNNESTDFARIISLKWPGNDMDYRDNKARIKKLIPALQSDLVQLIRKYQLMYMWRYKERSDWDLLAHSLGNELVREVFRSLPDEQYNETLFETILFAASDLDFDIYSTDSLMHRVHSLAEHCYIYYSERDLTLEVSNNLNKHDRLGRTGPADYAKLPVNTSVIDVTLVKDEVNLPDLITGHSYYRASPLVTADMLNAMRNSDFSVLNYRLAKEDSHNHFLISPKNVAP